MRQNPHVRICGGPGSATTLVYPTIKSPQVTPGYDEHMSPLQDLLASAVELDPVVDDPAGVFSGTTVSGRLLSVPMPSFGQR